MATAVQPPEVDLFMPLPAAGEKLDSCSILTHYFGFSIPSHNIGAFIYARCQPAFPLAQGGLCIFKGTDNIEPLDMAYMDYRNTMPWPEVTENNIRHANGLNFEFLELGRKIRVTYESPDKKTSLDIIQEGVTPMLARGHVVPGEELHAESGTVTGGMEQVMHVTGHLLLDGETIEVDCYNARDRSWGQIRPEAKQAIKAPPVGWSPMYFGDDLIFGQVGYENLETNPPWASLYDLPEGGPTTHFAWVMVNGEKRQITRVFRNVSEYHPELSVAMRQTIEAEDELGNVYRFTGEAIAMANMPAWPNAALRVGVYRWEDENGRVAYDSYQEMWLDDAPHKMMRAFNKAK